MTDPVLHLIAGPNGAGKSTFYDEVVFPVTNLPFVNADRIAEQEWPGHANEHAYDARDLASDERRALIENRESFATETVFSHASRIELIDRAVAAGYVTTLHVIVIPLELAVVRVTLRAARGGHDVPEERVRSRYERLWPLLATAIEKVEESTVYDNSTADRPFRKIATFRAGYLVGAPRWTAWTPAALKNAGRP